MNSELNNVFSKIREEFDVLDSNRENLLPISREIIRNCSAIIKSVHRNEISEVENKIAEIKTMFRKIDKISEDTSGFMGKKYLITAKQEYVEAAVLYSYLTTKKIPDYQELEVNSYEYVLGLADVIGELRRSILNDIRNDKLDKAEEKYDFMEDLYHLLFSLDYPSGLLPGFRKKVDTARILIQKTLEIITTSKNINRLNQNLEKVLKKQD